jgi:hypothetical protein
VAPFEARLARLVEETVRAQTERLEASARAETDRAIRTVHDVEFRSRATCSRPASGTRP